MKNLIFRINSAKFFLKRLHLSSKICLLFHLLLEYLSKGVLLIVLVSIFLDGFILISRTFVLTFTVYLFFSLYYNFHRWNKRLVFLHDPHDQDFPCMTARFHITWVVDFTLPPNSMSAFSTSRLSHVQISKYFLHDPHDQTLLTN